MHEFEAILAALKPTGCPWDGILAWFLHDYASLAVTTRINMSWDEGWFPPVWKRGIVLPLLKKSTLDPGDSVNYQPITNLPIWVKVIEKLNARQLQSHLEEYTIWDMVQSGFRPRHETETALACVWEDILNNASEGFLSLLVLNDLFVAFDMVNDSCQLGGGGG